MVDREKLESYINILVNEEHIKDMVVCLRPNQELIDLFPSNLVFNSVADLDLRECLSIRTIDDELITILRMTPAVTKLTIKLDLEDKFTAQDMIDSVFCLDKLAFLDISFMKSDWSSSIESKFKDIVRLLLNSFGKSGLVKLSIEAAWREWDIVQSFNLEMKPFNYFRLSNTCTDQYIKYKNRTMIIRDVSLPLLLAMEKFPGTKFIHKCITTADVDETKRSENRDLETIRDRLPRNKSVDLKISTRSIM